MTHEIAAEVTSGGPFNITFLPYPSPTSHDRHMAISPRKPGDDILDRYMPGASAEEREIARANLYQFIAMIIRIVERENTADSTIRADDDGHVELADIPTV